MNAVCARVFLSRDKLNKLSLRAELSLSLSLSLSLWESLSRVGRVARVQGVISFSPFFHKTRGLLLILHEREGLSDAVVSWS